MISATVLGIFFIPLLFVTVRKIFKGGQKDATGGDAEAKPTAEA